MNHKNITGTNPKDTLQETYQPKNPQYWVDVNILVQ